LLSEFIIVIVGCFVIVFLAHMVIKKTVDLADHFGLSGTFVGMTLLSIGTSLPEIMTHITGSLQIIQEPSLMNTVSSLVLGTNIGSDIFQQNFILGVIAILGTVIIMRKHIPDIIGGLIGGTLILFILSYNGIISRWEGVFLVIIYLAYLVYLRKEEKQERIAAKNHLKRKELVLGVIILLASFVVMAFVAREVLQSAEIIVKILPISASFFGIIIIGVAAALPELTTAFVALRRKEKEMSVGVLLGSNITNPTFALGIGAIISSYTVPNVLILYDLPIKLLGCLLILFLFLKYNRLGKREGVVLITIYLVYLIMRNLFFPFDVF